MRPQRARVRMLTRCRESSLPAQPPCTPIHAHAPMHARRPSLPPRGSAARSSAVGPPTAAAGTDSNKSSSSSHLPSGLGVSSKGLPARPAGACSTSSAPASSQGPGAAAAPPSPPRPPSAGPSSSSSSSRAGVPPGGLAFDPLRKGGAGGAAGSSRPGPQQRQLPPDVQRLADDLQKLVQESNLGGRGVPCGRGRGGRAHCIAAPTHARGSAGPHPIRAEVPARAVPLWCSKPTQTHLSPTFPPLQEAGPAAEARAPHRPAPRRAQTPRVRPPSRASCSRCGRDGVRV